ncbi:DUF2057 domain-containing protein [Shewanella sp. SR44-4]|uniref:DUF2057 domain-containing protein n=1 Tax=Shewanella sp. SR44-4 TaxID=2760935 RepID=UPI001603B101|nr:DUF2057 domain-containing protein [Shewanella sp. SR44-4]MBB1364273.1 DUF2057 domain-containing protein [Shewanella sp. SR44-4]
MRHIIALLCLTLSPMGIAASLQLPDRAETVLVNGKASQQQSSVKLDLSMPDNMQQIAFRYQARYRDNGSQNNFISDVVILRFQASEQNYQLTLPTINSASRANQFNDQPTITLTDNTGKSIVFTQDKLMKSGLQIGRDFAQEIAQYNGSGAIAAIASAKRINKKTATAAPVVPIAPVAPVAPVVIVVPVVPVVPVAPVAPVAIVPVAKTAEVTASNNTADTQVNKTENITQAEISRMLDYWYQKANPNTQAEFKAKIN